VGCSRGATPLDPPLAPIPISKAIEANPPQPGENTAFLSISPRLKNLPKLFKMRSAFTYMLVEALTY